MASYSPSVISSKKNFQIQWNLRDIDEGKFKCLHCDDIKICSRCYGSGYIIFEMENNPHRIVVFRPEFETIKSFKNEFVLEHTPVAWHIVSAIEVERCPEKVRYEKCYNCDGYGWCLYCQKESERNFLSNMEANRATLMRNVASIGIISLPKLSEGTRKAYKSWLDSRKTDFRTQIIDVFAVQEAQQDKKETLAKKYKFIKFLF